MCGRITMAGFANGAPPASATAASAIPKTDHIAPHPQDSFAIALDPAGKLYWARNEIGGDHLITVLTERVSPDYLAHLRTAGISYMFGGRDRIDLPMVLDKLASAFPIKTLLLEGGGKINGSMLQAGLVDEVSLLVAPIADGTIGTASVFDVERQPDRQGTAHGGHRLALVAVERCAEGVLWIRYRVEATTTENQA
jgi:riboflavin biosynthesis pyrimidine reductase